MEITHRTGLVRKHVTPLGGKWKVHWRLNLATSVHFHRYYLLRWLSLNVERLAVDETCTAYDRSKVSLGKKQCPCSVWCITKPVWESCEGLDRDTNRHTRNRFPLLNSIDFHLTRPDSRDKDEMGLRSSIDCHRVPSNCAVCGPLARAREFTDIRYGKLIHLCLSLSIAFQCPWWSFSVTGKTMRSALYGAGPAEQRRTHAKVFQA